MCLAVSRGLAPVCTLHLSKKLRQELVLFTYTLTHIEKNTQSYFHISSSSFCHLFSIFLFCFCCFPTLKFHSGFCCFFSCTQTCVCVCECVKCVARLHSIGGALEKKESFIFIYRAHFDGLIYSIYIIIIIIRMMHRP
jgi:hypothetical protein